MSIAKRCAAAGLFLTMLGVLPGCNSEAPAPPPPAAPPAAAAPADAPVEKKGAGTSLIDSGSSAPDPSQPKRP